MAQTVQDLVKLGLSEKEAERVINRNAKAEAKIATQSELAKKRLPKFQEKLAYAESRAAHWNAQVDELKAKVKKYTQAKGEATTEAATEAEPAATKEPTAPVSRERLEAAAKKAPARKS